MKSKMTDYADYVKNQAFIAFRSRLPEIRSALKLDNVKKD